MAKSSRPLWRRPLFLVAILIGLLLFVLWVGGRSLDMTGDQLQWVLLTVGGVLYAGLIIYALVGYLTERKLPQEMRDQARRQASHAGPESQRDFAGMEQAFQEAFEELAQVCQGKGLFRGEGATRIPWVIVIGPPGSGKTTALERSGLRFTPLGRRLQGIGGTRNCTWWLAEEAVLLDTVGRYATQDEDRPEWLSFLGLLRKRRRQPIDSAIVQVGLDEILPLSRRDQEAFAYQLRERLDELTRHLGVRFPVHLVFNKVDLLDGFIEYCGQLPLGERAQALGFSLDIDALGGRALAETFAARFDGLCDALLCRTTRYMFGVLDGTPDAREAALYFPAELRRHREALSAFAEVLFADSKRSERPMLTGVYLTSAMQGGAGLPGLRMSLGAELGIRAGARRQAVPREPLPFFLTGLFDRVVRQAQSAGRPNRERQRAMASRLRMSVAAGMAGCLGCGWLFAHGYRLDQQWLDDLTGAVKELRGRQLLRPNRTLPELDEELKEQQALLELLGQRNESGQLRAAHLAASKALRERIDDQLLRPLRPVIETHIFAASKWEQDGPGDVFARGYRALQADYILRRGECPAATPVSRERAIVDYASQLWWQQLGDKSRDQVESKDVRERLDLLLGYYFQRYFSNPRDLSAMQPAGQGQPEAKERLRLGSNKLNPALVFNLLTSTGGLYVQQPQLRGEALADDPGILQVFTQAGCRTFFSSEAAQGKEWWSCVLGVRSEGKLDIQGPELEGYFTEQYQRAWRDWIGQLKLRADLRKVHGAKNRLEELSRLLMQMSRTDDSELEQVMHLVGHGRDPERDRQAAAQRPQTPGVIAGCQALFKRGRTELTAGLDSVRTPQVCFRGEAAFTAYARAIPGDKPSELSDSYKAYLKSIRALDKDLQHLRRSTDGAADALSLVLNTMKDSGSLRDMAAARMELMHGLRNESTQNHVDPAGLSGALEELDRHVWRSLLSLGTEALNAQWNDIVYIKWKDLHAQAQKDPAYCPKVLDFVKQDLESHAAKNILPFFKEGGCEPRVPQEPFENPLISFVPGTCEAIQRLRALAQSKCAEGPAGPPPPPPEPLVPINAEYEPSTQHGCEHTAVQLVRLDNGAKIYDCNTALGRPNCAAIEVESKLTAGLGVQLSTSQRRTPVADAVTLDDLIAQKGERVDENHVRFDLPASKTEGRCTGLKIKLEFRARPRRPAGPAADNRWRELDLPQKLANLPKADK